MDDEVDAPARCGREGGCDGDALGDAHVGEGEGGHGVESVPAEPQDEGAERGEDGGVAGHVDDTAVLGEASAAGAQEDGAHESSPTASHVHDAGAREVDEAVSADHGVVGVVLLATVVRVAVAVAEGGQPALAGPAPVHHHGVGKAGDPDAVHHVSDELAALGDGALRGMSKSAGRVAYRHDGCGGSGERPLEHPSGIEGAGVARILVHEEVLRTHSRKTRSQHQAVVMSRSRASSVHARQRIGRSNTCANVA
eukprot:9479715-Pyramimonas_sp.AAC.3